jgi:hypothetical protein
MEQVKNGQRILGHGGDTFYFHSLMQLIPERHVGLFVAYNTDTSAGVREVLFDAFLRRYFPESDPARLTAGSGFRERAGRLAGEYGITRYSHSTAAKLGALLAVLKVTANDDDTLTIGMGDFARRYVEVEPLVFRELDGPRRMVFKESGDGKVRYLFIADVPPLSAVRHEWYELSAVHVGLLAGCVAIFASAFLYWPAIAFSVRGLESPRIRRSRLSALLSILAWLCAGASIVFTAGLGYAMWESNELAFGLPPWVEVLLASTQVCAVLAALTLLGCLIAWLAGYWRFTGRLHYTLVALAGIGFVWFLYYWNLLTFGLHGSLGGPLSGAG